MDTAPTRRLEIALGVAAPLCVTAIVLRRIHAASMQPYGDSAAQYIEHLARLRVALRLRDLQGAGPLETLLAVDGLYPPLLHLVTLVIAPLPAESVLWTGLIWMGLLALGVGLLVDGLGAGRRAALAAAVAATLIPGLHAASVRYYYDLPMSALLWLGLGLLAAGGWARSAGGGLALGAAALIKWSALPLGAPLVAGLLASVPRERRPRVLLGTAVGAAVAGGFVLAGSTSFGAMAGVTFQPPTGAALPEAASALLAALPQEIAGPLGAMALQVAALDGERLGFYPLRLAATVLSPLLSVGLIAAAAIWLRRGAPGGRLLAIGAAGHLLFLILLVPPLDDRFLLTIAPGAAIIVGGAWAGCRRSLLACAAAIGAALWVAGDFHLPAGTEPLHRDWRQPPEGQRDGSALVVRPGLSSSRFLRGWGRADEAMSDRRALRAAVWAAVTACGARRVRGPEPALSAWGDDNWWAYQAALGTLRGEPAPPRVSGDGPLQAGDLWAAADPQDAFGPVPGTPKAWVMLRRVPDPAGGPGVRLWALPQDVDGCPMDVDAR